MPAYGWLQRVRHNTYTVCYRGLVADHHLLVDHPSPRSAHLIRTVILHNLTRQTRGLFIQTMRSTFIIDSLVIAASSQQAQQMQARYEK
jgi:hypothetical protein